MIQHIHQDMDEIAINLNNKLTITDTVLWVYYDEGNTALAGIGSMTP